MSEPVNPYAAPKTLLSDWRRGVTPPRPRSLKWASFVLGVETCWRVATYWNEVDVHGLAAVVQDLEWIEASAFVIVPGWIACLLNRRNRVSFFLTSLALGAVVLTSVYGLALYRQHYSSPWFYLVAVLVAGLAYLFYRAAFGLPSRVYFGITPQKRELNTASTPNEH